MSKPFKPSKSAASAAIGDYSGLVVGVSELLEAARRASVRTVNAFMTATYWEVGRHIVEFEQGGEKQAVYGESLLLRLVDDLTARFGKGFGKSNLFLMRKFYLASAQIFQTPSGKLSGSSSATPIFQTLSGISVRDKRLTLSNESGEPQIAQTLSAQSEMAEKCPTPSAKSSQAAAVQTSAQFNLADLARAFPLPWSHYVLLISRSRSPEAFAFYHAEALRGGWSVRQLQRQMDSQLYERTALSRNQAAMLAKGAKPQPGDAVSADEEIRHPLVLEFLGLRDEYSETDLEDGLIRQLETFLLELGNDFAFVGRQRRLRLDDEWYRVDLLFYHRRLRCLVILDLKLGRFSHSDAGQICPVRYEQLPLRLRAEKPFRRKPLHRLHQRPSQTNGPTQRGCGSFHQKSRSVRTHLLRSLSHSRRCDPAGEISQNRVGQTIHQNTSRWLSHGVNLYLNYAREHWMQPGENPPVGVILCSGKSEALVRYATDALPNKLLVREYLTALPDEKVLAAELEKTRKQLELRK